MAENEDKGTFLGYDRNNREDLEDFTRLLVRIWLWLAYILMSYVMIRYVYFSGDVPFETPPEPEFILRWRTFVHWWMGWN